MIGRAVRCSSGRPGRSGRPSPWAARSFPVLIVAAAVLIGAGAVGHWFRLHLIHPHGSRWHRSRAAQFRRRMIRQNAAGRMGQILHLTAYRPIGNGELGSMPPYYPP